MSSKPDRWFERVRVLTSALTAGPEGDLALLCLEQAVAAVGADGGALALTQPNGRLAVVATTGYPPEVVSRFEDMHLTDDLPLTNAARLGRPISLTTAEARAERYPELVEKGADVRASLSLPLRFGESVLGALGVSYTHDRAVSPEELAFLEVVAAHSAAVLELRRLALLGWRADALFGSGLVGVIAGEGWIIRDANDRFLELVGRGRDELVAGLDWRTLTPQEHLEDHDAGQVMMVDGEHRKVIEKEYLRADGSRVPVLVGGTLLEREPSEWIAVVIDLTEQRRIEAELAARRGAEEEERFRSALASVVDAFAILSPVRDVAGRIVDFRYRYSNADITEIVGVPAEEVVGACLSELFPVDAESAIIRDYARVIETGVEVERDAARHTTADGSERTFDLRAARLGSDLLLTWRDVTSASRQAEAYLRHEAELHKARHDLEQERRVVDVLQEAVLPRQVPQLGWAEVAASYRSATEGYAVGGDWYDALAMPDGSLFVAIGDITGHGIETARIAVEARNVLRALMFEGHAPGDALTLLDRYFCRRSDEHFGTAAVAILRPDGDLQLALAGHLPPVLARPHAPAATIGTPQPPLGTGTRRRPHTPPFVLEPGGTLLLYTDGIVERRDEPIDVGLERLRGAVVAGPAAQVCDAVLAGFLPAHRTDDVCVLAVHRPLGR